MSNRRHGERSGSLIRAARGMSSSSDESRLCAWIAADPWRMGCLEAVASLDLADCWIGAGFLRNLVWDRLHGFARPTPLADIDVVFFDPRVGKAGERRLESRLRSPVPPAPCLRTPVPPAPWSVRNQARMHLRNGDAPYRSTADAMTHWLETPTAVAVRLEATGTLALLAPLGLDDLFRLWVRPSPHARCHRLAAYRARVAAKAWQKTWPKLRVLDM